MKTKNVRRVAGLMLQLVSFQAHAESEGGKDPFVFQAPAQLSSPSRYAADAGQERFPDLAGRATQPPVSVQMLAYAGSEAPLLAANAAPAGFDSGTVVFAQARSLERYEVAKRARVPVAGITVAER